MKKNTAVILAAGRGKRMLPLTETKPKPLQEVLGKNLLAWKIEALPDEITDVVMVIGYQGEQIRQYFGDTYLSRRISYVVQEELNGTAGALLAAREILSGRGGFFVMMGDDLYAPEDIHAMLTHDLAVAVREIHNKEMGGEMLFRPDGTFLGINEEKHFIANGFANTGLYMLNEQIFDYPPTPIGGSSTEFGLPHTLALLARDIPVQIVHATKWMQVSTPEDLKRAETEFFR